MSETGDAAYAAGMVFGLVVYAAMVVGGVLLVVSARRSRVRARQHAASPTPSNSGPSRGTAKLVAGLALFVLGLLFLLGRCAVLVSGAA